MFIFYFKNTLRHTSNNVHAVSAFTKEQLRFEVSMFKLWFHNTSSQFSIEFIFYVSHICMLSLISLHSHWKRKWSCCKCCLPKNRTSHCLITWWSLSDSLTIRVQQGSVVICSSLLNLKIDLSSCIAYNLSLTNCLVFKHSVQCLVVITHKRSRFFLLRIILSHSIHSSLSAFISCTQHHFWLLSFNSEFFSFTDILKIS